MLTPGAAHGGMGGKGPLESRLHALKQIVREAGALLADGFGRPQQIENKLKFPTSN